MVGSAACSGEGDELLQHVEGIVAVGQTPAGGTVTEGSEIGVQIGFKIRDVEVDATGAAPLAVSGLKYEIFPEEAACVLVFFE